MFLPTTALLLAVLALVGACPAAKAANPGAGGRFQRPVISRVYQQQQYALQNPDHEHGIRVNISEVAASLAGLKPSYVSSTIRLAYNTNLTRTMIDDFKTIRSAVLAQSPDAKFDIELDLDPNPPHNKTTYANADAVVAKMKELNSQIPLDGFWFDFYSNAQREKPEWVEAVVNYAHSNGQTVGGNIFDGDKIPPGSDAVAFDDRASNSTVYGFAYNPTEAKKLVDKANGTAILGHLNCNPQNGNTTESCTYMFSWNTTRRGDYLDYWWQGQKDIGFQFMLPLFFPLCPGAYSFSPLEETFPHSKKTLYDYIKSLALRQGSAVP